MHNILENRDSDSKAVVYVSCNDEPFKVHNISELSSYSINKSESKVNFYSFETAMSIDDIAPRGTSDRLIVLSKDEKMVELKSAIKWGSNFKWDSPFGIPVVALGNILALNSSSFGTCSPLKRYILDDTSRLLREYLNLSKDDFISLLNFING